MLYQAMPPPVDAPPGTSELGLGALWPTLLVLGLLVAALLFVRRRGLGAQRAGALLEVQAQLALSPGQTLYVVRAGDRRLLVGGAPGGLTLLTELDAKPAPAPAATAPTATEAAEDAAAGWLAAARGPHPLVGVDDRDAPGAPGYKGLR